MIYKYKNFTITKCQVGRGWNITDSTGKIVALHCATLKDAKLRIIYEIT